MSLVTMNTSTSSALWKARSSMPRTYTNVVAAASAARTTAATTINVRREPKGPVPHYRAMWAPPSRFGPPVRVSIGSHMGQGKHLLRKIQVAPSPADLRPVRRLGPLRAARDGGRDEVGAALVEFVLVLPVFMLLLLGMLTGGLAYSRKLSVAQAAREGARYGATLPITGTLPTDAWLAKVA